MKRVPTRGQAVIEGVMVRAGGVAYEVLRVSDRREMARWLRPVMAPGPAVQRLTTRPPSDDQIEVAITAADAALVRS